MKISFDNQIYEIDDDLTKLSEYIKLLHDEDPYEPLPLLKCNNEIFEIFKIWFNELKKIRIIEIPKDILGKNEVFVFKHNMFMKYNIEILYQLLDFSFTNQIFLLFETITLVIAIRYENKEFEIKQLADNYYTIDNIKIPKLYINIINNKNEKIFKVHQKEIDALEQEGEEIEEEIEELEEEIEEIKNEIKNLRERQREIEKEKEEENLKEITYTYDYSPENIENLINNFENTTIIHSNKLSYYEYKKSNSFAFLIPNRITKIGEGGFSNCLNLSSISIPETVEEINESAFEYCKNLTSITIPNSVRKIGKHAFYHCENLENINIPDSVEEIEECAFVNCYNLQSITIPEGITKIEDGIFKHCSKLTSITIPNSVKEIDEDVFFNCPNLEYINNRRLPEPQEGFNTNCQHSKFVKQSEMVQNSSNFTIPESIEVIKKYAFYKCPKLTNIIIPKSVKEIGDNTFYISKEDNNKRKITMPKCFYNRRKDIFNNVDNIEFILI